MTKTKNPKIAVVKLMQQSSQDEKLQQQLEKILEVGDGNISNEKELEHDEIQALKGEKGTKLTEFAHNNGFDFSVQDLIDVIEAYESYRAGEISDNDLFKILGIPNDAIALLSTQKVVQLFTRGRTYQKVVSIAPVSDTQNNPKITVINFMQKSAEDEKLQRQLEKILGVGDGNISNEKELDNDEIQALKGEKGTKITEFARDHGFDFSVQDLVDVIQALENYTEGKISDVNLFRILGIPRNALALLSTQKIFQLFTRGLNYQKVVLQLSTKEIRDDSKIPVIKFMQQTADNEILQKQLGEILGVGDGNISNEKELDRDEAEALKGEQGLKLTEFARNQGFDFSVEDLIDVVQAFEDYSAGKISDLKLFQTLGLSAHNIHLIPSIKFQKVAYRNTSFIIIDGVSIPVSTAKEANKNNVKTDVIKFMEKTAIDQNLRKELQSLLGVGDGDISSVAHLDRQEAEALKGNKSNLVRDLAEKQGFQFSVSDLIDVISAFQRHQSGEISEEQLFDLLAISKKKKSFFNKVADVLNMKILP